MHIHTRTRGWRLGLLAAAALSVALAGCGGGGGDDSPAPVATSFPLEAAYKASVVRGSTTDYVITGTCAGTARFSYAAPVQVRWDGASVLVVSQTAAIGYSNCTPATSTTAALAYYDLDHNPLATTTADGAIGRFEGTATGLPTAVVVGDTGVFGTETQYSDNTEAEVLGRTELSYEIGADTTPNTALATLVAKVYSADNVRLSTQRTTYRLTVDGGFKPVSIDLQYGAGSTTRLVFTPLP